MASSLDGDYSKFPAPLREPMRYLSGEACELRQSWSIHHRLFMESQPLTQLLSKQLGPLLGVLQYLLHDEMLLSISRLTDRDFGKSANLTVWRLKEGVPHAVDSDFGRKVDDALNVISGTAEQIRLHRNKRIAHLDLNIGIKAATLPVVTFSEIKSLVEQVEAYLNLFFWEFEQTTTYFDMLPATDITGKAEVTALKAMTYDFLANEGVIEPNEWRKRWRTSEVA